MAGVSFLLVTRPGTRPIGPDVPTDHQLDLGHMVTHRFGLGEFMAAYDVFADPARSGALKVVLSR
jgi:threonine dehydrogenase-like Zn-dependent dehydrogenase